MRINSKKLLVAALSIYLVSFQRVNAKLIHLDTHPHTVKLYENTNEFRDEAGYEIATGSGSLANIIKLVIEGFLGLLAVIFIILMIYSGFTWMTAGGDESKVAKAKQTIQRAIIGLIIIVAAYSITYFVFNMLPMGGPTGSGG